MDRLNAINVGYLKELPIEEIPYVFYDTAINEVNENFDEIFEIINDLPEVIGVNFLVVNFLTEINNGGLELYLNGEYASLHKELFASLSTIGADGTAEIARLLFGYVPQKGEYLEMEPGEENYYAIQELERQLKEQDEPVMDFLINYTMETLRDMNDEDYL